MSFLSRTEAAEIERALHKRHRARLDPGERFEVSAHLEGGYAHLTVLLESADKSFSYRMEGAINVAPDPETGLEERDPVVAAYAIVDFLDVYLQQFFESKRRDKLELDWREYDLETGTILVRGERRNRLLEELADKLLAEGETGPSALS